MSRIERPYVTIADDVEPKRPWADEHHDAVQLLVINMLRRFTGELVDALRKSASTHEMLAAQQVMDKTYFTSLGGQLRLMGVQEAAVALGVSRQRLHILRKRSDFPVPVADLLCGPVWLAQDIEQYHERRGKRAGRPRKEA